MKKNLFVAGLMMLWLMTAMAQKPVFFPGDGMYIVGIPSDLSDVPEEPTLMVQAYNAKVQTQNARLASVMVDGQPTSLQGYMSQETGLLDLTRFMGIGEVQDLKVSTIKGETYQLGDNAPAKTWEHSRLAAAFSPDGKRRSYTLGVYDHWDCPVSYEADGLLSEGKMDSVTVDFGNPHEGLVINNINFSLVTDQPEGVYSKEGACLRVNLRPEFFNELAVTVSSNNIDKVKDLGNGLTLYSVCLPLPEPMVMCSHFTITVSGFSKDGIRAWLPCAVDPNGIYPTHTVYSDSKGEQAIVTDTDACINVEGYFNYLGVWGWYDGKKEYGEVVPQGDYVQVYYSPDDPDYPGESFMGEVTFPVECTFGVHDIGVAEKPDWITDIGFDLSQWDDYGAVLLTMTAEALPQNMEGRNGQVVFTTLDGASQYTVYIKQGNADFSDAVAPTYVKYSHAINLNAKSFYDRGMASESDIYLDDAVIDVNADWGVTWIDLMFEEELQGKVDFSGVSIINTTTNAKYKLAAYTYGDEIRGNAVRMRLSTENYINTAGDQGDYVMTVPEGIAFSKCGLPTEAVTIRFTYGNPNQGAVSEEIVLDEYIGNYKSSKEPGEYDYTPVSFVFDKKGDGYYIHDLQGAALDIQLVEHDNEYVFGHCQNDSYAFGSSADGGDVIALFQKDGSTPCIYIGGFVLTDATGATILDDGFRYFVWHSASAISTVRKAGDEQLFNLAGQRVGNDVKGLVVKSGRKLMKK